MTSLDNPRESPKFVNFSVTYIVWPNLMFRWRINENLWVSAELGDDGQWVVHVTDVRKQPVSDDLRRAALREVHRQLSSLRRYIWQTTLK